MRRISAKDAGSHADVRPDDVFRQFGRSATPDAFDRLRNENVGARVLVELDVFLAAAFLVVVVEVFVLIDVKMRVDGLLSQIVVVEIFARIAIDARSDHDRRVEITDAHVVIFRIVDFHLHVFEFTGKHFARFAAVVFDQKVEETFVVRREVLRLTNFAKLLVRSAETEGENVIRVGDRRPVVRADA